MILHALHEYYNRKLILNQIDPIGFITKEIDFFVLIDKDGNYVDFENLRSQIGKRIKGTPFRVPSIGKQAQKHDNSGKDANLLWDKAEFVLGIGNNGKNKLEAFIKTIKEYYPSPNEDIHAILMFYEKQLSYKIPFKEIIENNEIGEIIRTGDPILTFKVNRKDIPITSESHTQSAINNKIDTVQLIGTCLITGDTNIPIENTHTVTKGIKGTQTSGANIVSFNKPSFLSYNKKQSENAPISKKASAAYTKALQNLIDSEHNKIRTADSTIVFWAEKKTEEINPEEIFPWIIAMQKTEKDDPDAGVNKIKTFIESIHTGQFVNQKTEHFYVLGLAPNAARIAVRFWKAPSVEDFGKNIKQHFEDFEIVSSDNKNKFISLYEILASVSVETNKRDKPNIIYYRGKVYDVLPQLAGQVVEAVLDNYLYPQSLIQQCIIRIRAEASKKDKNGKLIPNVTRTRTAVLKAYLNRKNRIQKLNQKEITMSLDTNNTDVAYRIGRLFATLEKIQEEANPGINTTIRDRYYGAASSSPITVFPRLLSLKNSLLKKLSEGRKINFEKLIGEILSDVKSFPTNLSLNEQAGFAIGYYHQRQDFFTSKSHKNEDQSNNQIKEN